MFEHAPIAMALLDPQGHALLSNPALERMVGYTAEELRRMVFTEFTHPEDAQRDMQLYTELVAGQRDSYEIEKRYRHKQGHIVWGRLHVAIVRGDSGEPKFFIGMAQDITARKAAERKVEESEQQFRTLAENIPGAVYRCKNDADWTMVFLSDSISDISGYPASEFVGSSVRTFGSIIYVDDREMVRQRVQESLEKAIPYTLEYRIVRSDGGIRWVYERGRGVGGADGQLMHLDGAIFDITERRQAQAALHVSEANLKKAQEVASIGSWHLDLVKNELTWTDETYRIFGIPIGKPLTYEVFLECVHPDDRDLVHGKWSAGLRGEPYDIEHRIVVGGRTRWIYEKAEVEFSDDETPIAAVGTAHDITERRQAEETLRDSETKLRAIFDHRYQLTGLLDPEGRLLAANRTALELVGVGESEVIGCYFWDCPWWDRSQEPDVRHAIERASRGEFVRFETTHLSADGEVRDIDFSLTPVRDEDGNPIYLVPEGRDITDHKQAQRALEASERRYRALYEHASEGIFLMRDDRFVECNPRALEIYGCTREQIVGMTPVDLSPVQQPDGQPSDQKAHDFIARVLGGQTQRFEWRHLRADGTPFDAEVSLSRLDLPEQTLLLALVRDVSERKRAQEKLMEYQNGLRSLASELSLAEERERRRVAGYLHDGPCQQLATSLMKLEAVRASAGAECSEAVQSVCQMIDRTVGDLRDLTFDLSPPTLYMLGLEAAIEELLKEQLRDKHGIAYEFRRGGLSRPLGDDRRVLLFQSVRELVTNIVKYASAKKVTVSIKSESDRLTVTVRDDGVGFDVSTVGSSVSRRGGYGLFSIKERLAYVGGELDIRSQPGHGSEFSLITPWETELD
ncbi:MAG: PAS domain S-box protein [Phycisphaerales bacterium]|nr:MAG: PAS domain S-box protein [Phycisphaerales bacterium]